MGWIGLGLVGFTIVSIVACIVLALMLAIITGTNWGKAW